MKLRSLFDFALGIAFGLLLAIPIRAQLRLDAPGAKSKKEDPTPGSVEEVEKVTSSLTEPVKKLEARSLYYFRDNVLAETKSYAKKDKAAIEAFLSQWIEKQSGPAKTLSFELKLKLRFPSDWSIDEIEQGRQFEVTSDDKLVRGIAVTAPRKTASQAQLLNDYMAAVEAAVSTAEFQILKGDSKVPEDWSGTSYTWLTRTKVRDHWLYQRRLVVFTKDYVIVIKLASWQKVFETWDPYFLHLTKDLATQAFEKQ